MPGDFGRNGAPSSASLPWELGEKRAIVANAPGHSTEACGEGVGLPPLPRRKRRCERDRSLLMFHMSHFSRFYDYFSKVFVSKFVVAAANSLGNSKAVVIFS